MDIEEVKRGKIVRFRKQAYVDGRILLFSDDKSEHTFVPVDIEEKFYITEITCTSRRFDTDFSFAESDCLAYPITPPKYYVKLQRVDDGEDLVRFGNIICFQWVFLGDLMGDEEMIEDLLKCDLVLYDIVDVDSGNSGMYGFNGTTFLRFSGNTNMKSEIYDLSPANGLRSGSYMVKSAHKFKRAKDFIDAVYKCLNNVCSFADPDWESPVKLVSEDDAGIALRNAGILDNSTDDFIIVRSKVQGEN